MNSQNIDNKSKIRKESKSKIKVDFDRTPLKDRLKAKFLSLFFLKKVVWYIIRFILLLGVSYIVLFPFFSKISASFMAMEDFVDPMVKLIPKNFTMNIYKELWVEKYYLSALVNTFTLSFTTAIIQTFVCSFIAYGFAKFKFKGNKMFFALVLLTMIIPHRTLAWSFQMMFNKFDILGIFGFLRGGGINILGIFKYTNDSLANINIIPETWKWWTMDGINLLNTYWPFIILSFVGLAFKNGLYIFLLRQFFMGVPDELEESAYMDGSGVFRTFFTIILPISIPMMITVFLFSFSWCWTDNFYTGTTMFFNSVNKGTINTTINPLSFLKLTGSNEPPYLLTSAYGLTGEPPATLKDSNFIGQEIYNGAVRTTGGLMIIAPLVIMYSFCQKFLVQGIERSGLTAD